MIQYFSYISPILIRAYTENFQSQGSNHQSHRLQKIGCISSQTSPILVEGFFGACTFYSLLHCSLFFQPRMPSPKPQPSFVLYRFKFTLQKEDFKNKILPGLLPVVTFHKLQNILGHISRTTEKGHVYRIES